MIRINRLVLHNFGIVRDEDITFTDRTVISGDNGEGKSTIPKALAYVFLGEIPGETPDPIKIADQANWGVNWDNKDRSSILCYFNIDDIEYKSIISIKRAGASKSIYHGDTLIADTNTKYNIQMNKWFDQSIAKYIIFSPQSTTQLVSAKPAELRDLITSMYHIEFTKEIEKVDIDSSKKALKGIKEDKEKQGRLLFELETELKHLGDKTKGPDIVDNVKQQKIDNMELDKKSSAATIKKVEAELDEIDKRDKKIDKLQNNMNNNQVKIDGNIKSIKKYNKDILNSNDIIKINNKTLIKNKDIILTMENNRNKLFGKNEDNITDLIIDKKNITMKLSLAEDGKCKECGAIHEYTSEQIVELRTELDNIINRINDRTTIDRKIADNTNVINKTETDNITYTTGNSNEHANIKKNKDKIKSDKDANIETQSIIDELTTKINALTIMDNNNKIEIESNLKLLKDERDNKEFDKHIESLKNKLENYNKYLVALELYNKSKKEKEDKIKAVKNSISTLKVKINGIDINILNMVAIVKDKEIIIARLKSDLPSHISNDILQSLVDSANDIMLDMYDKYPIDINKSKNGISLTYNKGKAMQAASGAEQALINAAFQIAIGKMLNFGPMIIDEVDSAMSSKNSENLYDNINLLLDKGKINQVIAISHLDSTKQYLSNNHYQSITMINGKVN